MLRHHDARLRPGARSRSYATGAVLLAVPQSKSVSAATYDEQHGYRALDMENDDGR